MTIEQSMMPLDRVIISQRKELWELLGAETRNKYEIQAEDGRSLGFAAEQRRGFFGMFLRQIFGHWRSFTVTIFDPNRQPVFIAQHPFRFYFQRIKVTRPNSPAILGSIERRFAWFSKHFDICLGPEQRVSMTVRVPFWRIWRFPFRRHGQEVALIEKKWGGTLKEIFVDADTFLLSFNDRSLSAEERVMLLCSALFIDLMYFENNQAQGTLFDLLDPFG